MRLPTQHKEIVQRTSFSNKHQLLLLGENCLECYYDDRNDIAILDEDKTRGLMLRLLQNSTKHFPLGFLYDLSKYEGVKNDVCDNMKTPC